LISINLMGGIIDGDRWLIRVENDAKKVGIFHP